MRKISDIEAHSIHATLLTIALILCLLLASSCTPNLQKAIAVATKTEANSEATINAIHKAHPIVTAEHAARVYPPKTGQVIKGEEQVKEETTEQPPVVVPCEDAQGQPVQQVTCPPAKTTIRTMYRTDTLKILDTAALEAARLKTEKAVKAQEAAEVSKRQETERADAMQEERNEAYIFSLILMLALGGMFYWFVIRR